MPVAQVRISGQYQYKQLAFTDVINV